MHGYCYILILHLIFICCSSLSIRTMSSFNPLSFTLAYHTLHTYGLSLSQSLYSCCLLTTWSVSSDGSPVMSRTKWSTTYTRYFALRIQLLAAPQSPFSLHLGVVMLERNINKSKMELSAWTLMYVYLVGCTIKWPQQKISHVTDYVYKNYCAGCTTKHHS